MDGIASFTHSSSCFSFLDALSLSLFRMKFTLCHTYCFIYVCLSLILGRSKGDGDVQIHTSNSFYLFQFTFTRIINILYIYIYITHTHIFHWYLEEVKVMVTYGSIRPTLSICFNLLSQESQCFLFFKFLENFQFKEYCF